MRNLLALVIVVGCAAVSVSAQADHARQDRKQYLEDKTVTLRVDKAAPAVGSEVEDNFLPRTSYSYPVADFKPGVVRVGRRTTYIKEGLSTAEVVRLLGRPSLITERSENEMVVTTYEFQRSEGQILIAEFVKDLLVRSRSESRDDRVVQADR
jgi:hypothetical protein